MTEHAVHAPHHTHVRKAIDALHKHHAALLASHREPAAAEAERRAAAFTQERISAVEQAQP
jgi:hypothetical protein